GEVARGERNPGPDHKATRQPGQRPDKAELESAVAGPEHGAPLPNGWQEPHSDDATGDAVDMVTTILGGTESSRLVRRLRDEERLISGLTMNCAAQMGGGIVSLRVELEAENVDKVERIIFEEIAKMQEKGPTDDERQLALTKFESQHAFDTETSEGLANAYGLAETTWTLDAEVGYVDRLRKITNDQIKDAARRYLSQENFARIAFTPRKP